MNKIPKEDFQNWLDSGTAPLTHITKDTAYSFIKHPKNDNFDYLYCQHAYHTDSVKMGEDFKYWGVYNKLDHKLYDEDCGVSQIVEDWRNNGRTAPNTMATHYENAVCRRVEDIIGNDRSKLSVTQITEEKLLNDLEYFKSYRAGPDAREAFLAGDAIEDLSIKCGFSCRGLDEKAYLQYITDQDSYVQIAAEMYIDLSQECLLSQFLELDMVKSEYQKLIDDTENPVHRIKAIIAAVDNSSAKTINVTVCKDGQELRFKTDPEQFKHDCVRTYSTYTMAAADRREFERVFGRHSDYSQSDITQITYGKNVLYQAELPQVEQTEDTGMSMSM